MSSPKERQPQICQCGCGETFYPFTTTKKGVKVTPIYKRGHHPNCKATSFGKVPAWNKGLTKEDCPTLTRMGFQPGHKPYNDWSHVVEKQRNDPEYRKRWIESKKGQVAWNKGKTKDQYANGIKSGEDHGNWQGGKRGIYDTAALKAFAHSILKRDGYKCQHCGDHNYKGRGSRVKLECHHIVAIAENHLLALDPSNAITLCRDCHIKTDNYGTKLVHARKNRGR